VLFVEWLYLRTGDELYRTLAKRWTKVMAALFAAGVVTGTILSFEMGLLWPAFTASFGSVFGLGFAIEGFSFFVEAIFIGICIYGWSRLSPRAHFASGIPLAIAGITALGGVAVLRSDAHPLYHGLVEGKGLIGLLASIIAGSATLALLWSRRYEASRYTAALAVAAIIAGWALAQSPVFLEGLTVREAAAGRDTLVAVTVAVLAGAAILFPSLALLFRLVLGGDLGRGQRAAGRPTQPRSLLAALAPGLLPRLAIACLVAGIGFTTIRQRGLGTHDRRLLSLRLHRRRISRGSPTSSAANPPQESQCRESGPAVTATPVVRKCADEFRQTTAQRPSALLAVRSRDRRAGSPRG
jgi:hypothetical protein